MIYFAKWKIILIAVVCVLGLAYSAPNLVPRKSLESVPSWLPNQQISLGLDLRGGSHLTLQVDFAKAVENQLDEIVDDVRYALRSKASPPINYRGLGHAGRTGVQVTIINAADVDRARSLLRDLGTDYELKQDGQRLVLTLTEKAIRDRQTRIISQSIEIVRRRIDETGTKEPTIQRQGDDRIIVQLPGVDDPERVKRLIDTEAILEFHLVDTTTTPSEAHQGRLPPGSEILPSDPKTHSPNEPQEYVVQRRAMVHGDDLVDARSTYQQGRPVVSFRFNTAGGRDFGRVTSQNVGKPFAIVLDNKVISAPVIREPILGGNGVISGSFSLQETQDLALLLRAGALPAPLTVLEERTVGPGLGADSIRAGELASVLALVFVILFMAVAYGLFGLMANVALLVNMILITALLSLLQATLTLPGIAGIVLTVGMAVDANVLIFERIREEQRAGRTPISAIDAGFQRALTTIIDANITTFIAALLLFIFGSGPVQGFAVTLAIGLATSMFTAIMVTRLQVVLWLRHRRPRALPV